MRPAINPVIVLNRQAGIPTTTELTFGTLNLQFESEFFEAYCNDPKTPLRVVIVADAATFWRLHGDGTVEVVTGLAEDNAYKAICSGFEFFADNAFLGLAMAVREAGCLDPNLRGI